MSGLGRIDTMESTNRSYPVVHWKFPDTAKFGRVIPKEKLYQQVGASATMKKLFVEQVGQIKWAYKLAEGTINLTKTDLVKEIEIINITLKSAELSERILTAIDKAIPHPTLFVLKRKINESEQIRLVAAHKLKTVTGSGKETWQQSQYLKSAWFSPVQVNALPLPTVTNLQRLYEQLLEALVPKTPKALSSRVGEPKARGYKTEKNQSIAVKQTSQAIPPELSTQISIEKKLTVLAEIEALMKKLQQTKVKRDKEKQFNRRRELNDDYKALKQQLAKLHASI